MVETTQAEIARIPVVGQSCLDALPGSPMAANHAQAAVGAPLSENLHSVFPADESIQEKNLERPG
jgi:hypothetical protein